MSPDSENRFFNSGGAALRCIENTLDGGDLIRIATAYFEPSGYQCLRRTLRGKELRLLIGRPGDQEENVRTIIREFIEHLTTGDLADRTAALMQMKEALEQGLIAVSVGLNPDQATTLEGRYHYQHAKLYMIDEEAVVVTSANMSRSGLVESIEAGIVIRDAEDVRFFVERFDEIYQKSRSITDELLELLRDWLADYSPFEVYCRALLDVYGLPEEETPGELPRLAAYQRPVVSRALQAIADTGGAMLVASTGLGKTVMAAHITAYLRMRGEINSVLILCPAGLREMWRRTMRAAKTSSAEFSYSTLSGDDWKRNRQIGVLEHELEMVNAGTLIIVDECHHLRNEEQGGELRLRNSRVEEAVGRGAKILLMTATPYSRGIDDINAQLRLLPVPTAQRDTAVISGGRLFGKANWEVESPGNLADLPNCVVLTSPSVVRHFSHTDDRGERYVLFSGDQKRYFPRSIHLYSRPYRSDLDEILLELLGGGLLHRPNGDRAGQGTLFVAAHENGRRDPLFESHVVHQFCSSTAQAGDLLGRLACEGGFQRMRFARQRELGEFVGERLPAVEQLKESGGEDKLIQLIEIIHSVPGGKIVIFCVYRATAKYLADILPKIIKGLRVETTADREIDTLERILKAFAPLANEAVDYDEVPDEIDVLVATGALAEGFNLQDASVLINFDLPWTVLMLAQRMGRILRPWHEPREIHIHNLIPSTMKNPDIHLAMNWEARLLQRNREHSSFADIPVMMEKDRGRAEMEMFQLASTMQDFGTVDLELDEAIHFIENAEQLRTTPFLDDLALLDETEVRRIRLIPPGFRSFREAKRPGLFVLFNYGSRFCPVLFSAGGVIELDIERQDAIMNRIRCTAEELRLSPFQIPQPAVSDAELQRARERWAQKHEIDHREVTIICALFMRQTE